MDVSIPAGYDVWNRTVIIAAFYPFCLRKAFLGAVSGSALIN